MMLNLRFLLKFSGPSCWYLKVTNFGGSGLECSLELIIKYAMRIMHCGSNVKAEEAAAGKKRLPNQQVYSFRQ
jgi:hypothetical protein